MARYRDAYDALFSQHAAFIQTAGHDATLQLANPCRVDATLAQCLGAHDLGAIAAALLGADAVQLLQDMAIFKPALQGGAVQWHQDESFLGYLQPPRLVTARLALDDETVVSGCMQVLDCSHLWDFVLDARTTNWCAVEGALGALPTHLHARVAPARRDLVMRAGDVSFHHPRTLHASHPNLSANPRRTLVARLFDAACMFEPDGLADRAHEPYFPHDNSGHLALAVFPQLWPLAL